MGPDPLGVVEADNAASKVGRDRPTLLIQSSRGAAYQPQRPTPLLSAATWEQSPDLTGLGQSRATMIPGTIASTRMRERSGMLDCNRPQDHLNRRSSLVELISGPRAYNFWV